MILHLLQKREREACDGRVSRGCRRVDLDGAGCRQQGDPVIRNRRPFGPGRYRTLGGSAGPVGHSGATGHGRPQGLSEGRGRSFRRRRGQCAIRQALRRRSGTRKNAAALASAWGSGTELSKAAEDKRHLDKLRRTQHPDDARRNTPLRAVDQLLFEEAGESRFCALFFLRYNFARIHRTLRATPRWRPARRIRCTTWNGSSTWSMLRAQAQEAWPEGRNEMQAANGK